MPREVQPPSELDVGGIYRGLQGDGSLDGEAVIRELGRRAARDGWARRLLLDLAHGRLCFSPYLAVAGLCELADVARSVVTDLLASQDPTASLAAGLALGRAYESCEAELLAAAEARDESVRLAAAAGLGEAAAAGEKGAVEALGRLLGDARAQVRWAAATNLGGARGGAAVPALAWLSRAMGEGDEQMVSGCVFGLARLWPGGKRGAMALLLSAAAGAGPARRAVALAMRQLPRRSAARLAGICLADSDPDVRALSVGALGAWGKESAAARRELARLARDPQAVVRAAASEALAAADRLGETDLVARLADDPSALVRAAVAAGLGRGARSDLNEVMARLARDEAAPVRMAAMRGLVGAAAQGLLREACRDPEPGVRAAALSALAGDRAESESVALSLSYEHDPSVVRAAAQALGRCARAGSGKAWARLVELAAGRAARAAATEGLAAALDRRPDLAARLMWDWAARDDLPDLLARIARGSTEWRVAELARTAARVLGGEEASIGEAVRDLARALSQVGERSLAAGVGWLADCAEAGVGQLEGPAAKGPRQMGAAFRRVAQVVKAIAEIAQSQPGPARDRHRARGLAALEELLSHEEAGLEWALARRVAKEWRDSLVRGAAQAGGGVRAQLVSRTVLSGGGTVVVEIQNDGHEAVSDIVVTVGDVEAIAPDLAGKQSCEVEVSFAAAGAVRASVRGTVGFRARGARSATRFEGSVSVVVPKPMGTAPNPYVVGKPLSADSAMFFGREQEMACLERALSAGDEGSVLVLVGPRRIGKTSFLRRAAARISYAYHSVYVDVQGMLVSGTGDFFRELARTAAGDRGMSLSDGDLGADTHGPDMVREVAGWSDRPLVLLLDEFDDLEEKVRSGRLGPEVFGGLRNLMQHSPGLRVVLSGTHRLEEMGGDHWSFLLNLATYRRMGCLQPEEAVSVLMGPFSQLGIACEEAAVLRALRLTGGHPYFLQLLGYRLVEGCVAAGEGAVSVASVARAAEQVVEQGDIHLRYLWEAAGPEGQAAIAELATDGAALSEEQLRVRMGLTGEAMRKLLDKLTAVEVIAEGGGRWALRMELLARWLQRAQPERWKVS